MAVDGNLQDTNRNKKFLSNMILETNRMIGYTITQIEFAPLFNFP